MNKLVFQGDDDTSITISLNESGYLDFQWNYDTVPCLGLSQDEAKALRDWLNKEYPE